VTSVLCPLPEVSSCSKQSPATNVRDSPELAVTRVQALSRVRCYSVKVPNLLPQWVDVTRPLVAIGLTVLAFALGAYACSVKEGN